MSSERLEEYEDNLKALLRDLETQVSITLSAVTGGTVEMDFLIIYFYFIHPFIN